MKYVVLRDDDTNALTPAECLERLYRPFLNRGLPVNLAVIPNVNAEAAYLPGQPEKFLMLKNAFGTRYVPIDMNRELVNYLRANPLYHIAQHGCCHESVSGCREFDHDNRADIAWRLDQGAHLLRQAGLGCPEAFVAPYDRLSTVSFQEVARRFRVLSTGWYEWKRLPLQWRPKYLCKKLSRAAHWRVGRTVLLSHPGCKLSWQQSYAEMLDQVKRVIEQNQLTVLVTHWWEYFRDGVQDSEFVGILHRTADFLAGRDDLRVVSFGEVADKKMSLH